MRLKRLMIISIIIISLFVISSVSAVENTTIDVNVNETVENDIGIENDNYIELDENLSVEKLEDCSNEDYILSAVKTNEISSSEENNQVLGVSLLHDAYSVHVNDLKMSYGDSGTIFISISPAPYGSYFYVYDFYLRICDSEDNVLSSERFSDTSYNYDETYTVSRYSLEPGVYTIKIVNYADNYVMDTAKLTVQTRKLPYSAYSVRVSDTIINYGAGGEISMRISSASEMYYYKYDYNLNIYNSDNYQVISKRFYSIDRYSIKSYTINPNYLIPGVYTIKLVNREDNYVMNNATLIIESLPSSAYSVGICDTRVNYDSSGSISLNITPSSGYNFKHDFYLKIYDSDNNLQCSKRFYEYNYIKYSESYAIESYSLNCGVYTVKLINTADNYEMAIAKLYILNSPDFGIYSEDYYINEMAKIDYNINDDATGIFNVYLNDIFIENVNVGNQIELGYLNEGYYDVKVFYSGDNNYSSYEDTTSFNVYRLPSYYYIDEYELVAGDNISLTLCFDETNVTGNLNISIGTWKYADGIKYWVDNYIFNEKLVDGNVNMIIPVLLGGINYYKIEYEGNEIYAPIEEYDEFYVQYKDSPININIPNITWSETVNFIPTLPKGATGSIEILIDDVSMKNMSIGQSYSYYSLIGGKHNITIKYSGNSYYCENETTVEFYVNKLGSTLTIESIFDSEKYITVPITLNEDANGVITVNINNNIFSGNVINGSFNFMVTDLGAGVHNAIINYTGDDKYNDIYIVKEIVVNLKDANLDLNIKNILKGQNLVIKPILADGATGTLSIYVDDDLMATLNQGSSYTLKNQGIGQHKIRLNYSGDKYFASAEREFSFRVFTIYPIEADDTQIVYGTDKKFQAKFYDEHGAILANKYVSFIVNGSEYPVKTNSEGIAVLDADLGIGEYNVTSVSIFDESTTNSLLIFHSVEAQSMIIEWGSETKFSAKFLDESGKPLLNTNVRFEVDGSPTMVKTDVNGVAILKTDLSIGTHYITSINTLTDENMTNKVVVVSNINSIIVLKADDIDYGQNETIKLSIDSAYLNADVIIRITGENGYEKIFTQKAAKTITRQLSGLNASKYLVEVIYKDEDLLVIVKNTTFNVFKITPQLSFKIKDGFVGKITSLDVIVSDSNGNLTVKIDEDTFNAELAGGKFTKSLGSLSVGPHSLEILFNGDNNYKPLVKTAKFNIWNVWDFDVYFDSKIVLNYDDYQFVSIYNLTSSENAFLTLYIDGVKVKDQSFELVFNEYGYGEDGEEDFTMVYEYNAYVQFNSSYLTEGIHIWQINYFDGDNYINSSKSGIFKAYDTRNPDKEFLVTYDGDIIEISSDFAFVKKGSSESLGEYTIYSFTAGGNKYNAIRWFPVAFYSVGCYKVFDPSQYKFFEGFYYKTANGKISEIIDSYSEVEGIYYKNIGRPYEYYNNGYDINYFTINTTCYKSQYYHCYEAVEGVDYKVIDGRYFTLEGIEIEDRTDIFDGFAIVNNGEYYFSDNIYQHRISPTVGYDYVKFDNEFYRLIRTYVNEELHNYALIDGKLYPVIGDSLGNALELDVSEHLSENEISIPSLNNPSADGSIKVTLPSDATGTVTLTINKNDYNFTVVDGVANIVVPSLEDGNYPYTITYSGNGKYSAYTTVGTLNKINPKIVASNINVIYASGSYYTIKVYDTDGKPANDVIVKITGQIKKTITAINGIAKFKVNQVPGKYKITITALGKSVTKNLKVKDLVVLYTTTFKKSAKKLTLMAKLAKINGKYLKNKKITFKINGKKVASAKTNKKGIAKITIKTPNVVKNLKVGKKLTYEATYLKDTVKKTAKVKK